MSLVIRNGGDPSLPPKLAVPSFIALTNDAETQAAAKIVGDVIWDDLEFEKEYYMIPRDTYRSIPQPASLDQVPLDRWKELNADAVLIGSVAKTPKGVLVSMRLINVASGASAMAREYSGSATSIQANPVRAYAHTIADEVHKEQRGLNGIARTKIAFSSDRDGERIRGPVGDRGISNIYMSDYDGARQQRVTISKSLDISPVWSPDGRSIAFSSWRTSFQDIYVLYPYGGPELQNPTKGNSSKQNYLPGLVARWLEARLHLEPRRQRRDLRDEPRRQRRAAGDQPSDDRRHADVVADGNAAGVHLRPLRHAADLHRQRRRHAAAADHPRVGTAIVRPGRRRRSTRSPTPRAPAVAISSRSSISQTRSTRALTDNIGNNESPAFSPNGRHIAFVSSRAGKEQIFTIHRDGSGLRQITRTGTNRYPHWSK